MLKRNMQCTDFGDGTEDLYQPLGSYVSSVNGTVFKTELRGDRRWKKSPQLGSGKGENRTDLREIVEVRTQVSFGCCHLSSLRDDNS